MADIADLIVNHSVVAETNDRLDLISRSPQESRGHRVIMQP